MIIEKYYLRKSEKNIEYLHYITLYLYVLYLDMILNFLI